MDYPARLDVTIPDKIDRWRPMFNWILAIPHFIVVYALSIVGQIVAIVSWFAILFTGKLPEGLGNVQCMVQRYSSRVGSFAAGLQNAYPPFEFSSSASDPGGYGTRADFAVALEGRNRLTCALRIIWAIPAAIVMYIIAIVAFICWFLGAIIVLFTGSWPGGMQSWVLKGLRASLRFNTYLNLLTDEYPPLNFD